MCDKITYQSFGDAQAVINGFRNFKPWKIDGRRVKRRQPDNVPTRAYKCDECGGYHLTKMKAWKKKHT